MPTAGLSLVGFMSEPEAVFHLSKACVPAPNADDARLKAEWAAAKAKLGAAVQNAGAPEVLPIPAAHMPYIDALLQLPWVVAGFQGAITQADFKLVEIDTLLAFQFQVDTERAAQSCVGLASPPTMDQLLAICLPTAQPNENFDYNRLDQAVLLKARTLNLRVREVGIIQGMLMGLTFGPALPFAQVTKFSNRMYLSNGYHRAFGIRRGGATHMPCLVRDVANARDVGIVGGNATFSEALMTSADAPTVGHFARGSAFDVRIRRVSRILHVSWAEHIWAEE
jgi:hypothetical protein